MGLWYFTPAADSAFAAGMKHTSTVELRRIAAYMESIHATGFHVADRCRALKAEISRRDDMNRRLGYGN